MIKKLWLTSVILACLGCYSFVSSPNSKPKTKEQAKSPSKSKMTINMTTEKATWHLKKPIFLKVAYTMEAQKKGFMGYKEIPEDFGILFMYHEERILNFWMANCWVDIDILFLNEEGKIIQTYSMPKEEPKTKEETDHEYYERLPRYSSISPARFAIEIKSGKIKELGLKVGDLIQLNF